MLCQALGIDRRHDGGDLIQDNDLMITDAIEHEAARIGCTPRIGISRGIDAPLRFVVKENRYVSR